MNYAEIKYCDVADGPGVRTSLFVSGCTHHCKGCFNAMTWDFNYGKPFTEEVEEEILKSLEPDYIAGFTLLGGEPFEPQNQPGVLPLLRKIKARFPEKSIWCFSGYLFDRDILGKMCAEDNESREITREILSYIDVLIDGPFILEKKNLMLKFKGSENQRTIDVKKSLETGRVELLPGY
ncbi:MAG: anaerobic ribonucleoside-triphosphate reductase activating protein [Lachnospiraceae bacterium]|nr:anaerobic ribonucleoside-triphosphate reductase activating protein [Lachnospiraceae bacterium]